MLEWLDLHWEYVEVVLVVLFLLLTMWVEKKTPEELAAAEERRKMQAGIDRNATPHMPKYNIFVGTQCVFGTDNEKLAQDAFYRECKYTDKEVRLFFYSTVINKREQL